MLDPVVNKTSVRFSFPAEDIVKKRWPYAVSLTPLIKRGGCWGAEQRGGEGGCQSRITPHYRTGRASKSRLSTPATFSIITQNNSVRSHSCLLTYKTTTLHPRRSCLSGKHVWWKHDSDAAINSILLCAEKHQRPAGKGDVLERGEFLREILCTYTYTHIYDLPIECVVCYNIYNFSQH